MSIAKSTPPLVLMDPPFLDPYDPRYPDSDGKPMADNSTQFNWMVTIKEGLESLFEDDPNVFIAGDMLWYAVEGDPKQCMAPDVMVAFNRPKADRHSYKQWWEGSPPNVVFEIHSPKNTKKQMERKLQFYDEHGVEEYYYYKPKTGDLFGWRRNEAGLQSIPRMDGWRSPRLGVTFEAPRRKEALVIHRPDGRVFETYRELHHRADAEARRANEESHRADEEARRANDEARRALEASRRAQSAEERAEAERQRADRLAARLRALGLEDDE
ncbi:Uma2 family endonuclease [Paludisphaera rhizosphaerae]|uniref:Uma2 family endonuclease n=1 Tax=Paludisphaera rhizosphaerae TaxID=2711216 RepID=UPI001F0E4604|nr:Uma2 family endonuclease [Paludisphaera rhizosphaerae]